MCGIVGVAVRARSGFPVAIADRLIRRLYLESETRGKEASGVAVHTPAGIRVHKEARSASFMLSGDQFKAVMRDFADRLEGTPGPDATGARGSALIGHTRLTTSGAQGIPTNNQPVARDGVVAVHNGIIVNFEQLWKKHAQLGRKTDVDTEVVVALFRHFLRQTSSVTDALRAVFQELQGTASLAFLLEELDDLVLATNTGSLYVASAPTGPAVVFASERAILERVLADSALAQALGTPTIQQVRPGRGLVISLRDLAQTWVELRKSGDDEPVMVTRRAAPLSIHDTYEEELAARAAMRRCTRCILPETFPFIEFDSQGVCNLCRRFKPLTPKGPEALEAAVAPHRSRDGEPDCLIAFSGGRDSCYCLHYAVRELKLTPIVYTYDWGMVNDLARRNQARLCGKLGVEQILVSADIKRKRENIGLNVRAWLKQPDLGTVPLFMAGDKQFFYYARQIAQRTRLGLTFWAINELERTNFKVGFCGIREGNSEQQIYNLAGLNKLRMIFYYARRFATNPAYINRSLLDTAFAFMSYYMIQHDYISFFDYIPWNEDHIGDILVSEYDWERSPDTPTAWRIGDETAAFYNYIYTTIAGFSENDTFRSNQIRQGLLDRERGLQLATIENAPRWESIKRYLALINIDFDGALSIINSVPKLYMRPRR